eukprot:scaffold613684_cov28-Prasinocladus_malaysianus.AAC.1
MPRAGSAGPCELMIIDHRRAGGGRQPAAPGQLGLEAEAGCPSSVPKPNVRRYGFGDLLH